MGDVLIPNKASNGESLSQRWGLSVHYNPRLDLATFLSEGGSGHSLGLTFDVAENFQERYPFALEFSFGHTEGKLFPSEAEGTRTNSSHWGIQGGFGRSTRSYSYFSNSGNMAAALNVTTTPLIGIGFTTISPSDRELEGEVFDFDQKSERTWDLGTAFTVLGEFRPWGRGPTLGIGPSFYFGTRYAGEGSEFNRLSLELMLMLQVGYGDASVRGSERIGAMGIAQGLFTMFHGWLARDHMNKILSGPNEALSNYGPLVGGDSGDRGSMANVPVLEASAAVASGLGNPLDVPLRTNTGWYWGFLALRTLGGAIFLISDGDAGKSGGLADGLLGSARLAGFAIAGMESPDKRAQLSDETMERREIYINLAAFGLNTLAALLGAAAESDPLMQGGAGANIQVGLSPDPLDGTMVERTDIGYVPTTLLSGDKSGSRAGVLIHKSWRDFPSKDFQLFSSVLFLSPAFRLDNVANHPTQSEPYEGVELNTDVDAALGLEWKTGWTRLSFGLDTKVVYGGGEKAKVGIGVMGGFDLTIPIGEEDGPGISLGARVMAHKLFPEGTQVEVVPHIGATLVF